MTHLTAPYARRAYYYETDKMGIIHHSNYIRWFEEARIDFMQQTGLKYDDMENKGIIMPVIEVSCKYIVSVHFNEAVEIFTSLKLFNGVRAVYNYEIYNASGLAATGQSSHCFLDNVTRTPINLKNRYPEFYKNGLLFLKGNKNEHL